MQQILIWLGKYNVSTHTLGIIAIALTAAFEGYKPFHDLVTSVYTGLPTAIQVLIGTGGFLYALYKTGALAGSKETSTVKPATPPAALILVLLAMAALLLCPAAVRGQAAAPTPAGFVASSDALAIGANGTWGAGNLTTESYDFLDYGATKSNRIFAQGVELAAPSVGLSVYGGGLLWQPDISALIKKTNLPSGNFLVFVDASAGNGIPATGKDRVSGVFGGGLKYIVNDTVTWNTIRFEEVFFGNSRYPAISAGISAYFGGTPSSAAISSNVKRALTSRIAKASAATK